MRVRRRTSPFWKRMTLMRRFSRTMVHSVVQLVSSVADTASFRLISTGKEMRASAMGDIMGALCSSRAPLSQPIAAQKVKVKLALYARMVRSMVHIVFRLDQQSLQVYERFCQRYSFERSCEH